MTELQYELSNSVFIVFVSIYLYRNLLRTASRFVKITLLNIAHVHISATRMMVSCSCRLLRWVLPFQRPLPVYTTVRRRSWRSFSLNMFLADLQT